MSALKQQRHGCRLSPHRTARGWAVGVRIVGAYFAGTAVLNAGYTVRNAPGFLHWLAENSWFPPYRQVIRAVEPVAPAIILSAAVFQGTVAYHLLRGRARKLWV